MCPRLISKQINYGLLVLTCFQVISLRMSQCLLQPFNKTFLNEYDALNQWTNAIPHCPGMCRCLAAAHWGQRKDAGSWVR